MAKNPEQIVRKMYHGTPVQMQKIKSWADERDMKISDFLHAATAHYAQSGEATDSPGHFIEKPASKQVLIFEKLNQILHAQAQPHSSEDDAAEDDYATKFEALGEKLVVMMTILNKVECGLGDELPKRDPKKYESLRPEMVNLPAMEANFFLLNAILNQLSRTPKGQTVAKSLIDRITQL